MKQHYQKKTLIPPYPFTLHLPRQGQTFIFNLIIAA